MSRKNKKDYQDYVNPTYYKVNAFEPTATISIIEKNPQGLTKKEISLKIHIEESYLSKILDKLMEDMRIIKVDDLYYSMGHIKTGVKPRVRRL